MLNELPAVADSLKEIDDIDTRREMKVCLDLMTVAERIDFLHWCAGRANRRAMLVTLPPWVFVEITHTSGDSQEVILDLCMIHSHFGLPMSVVLRELERRASASRRLFLAP